MISNINDLALLMNIAGKFSEDGGIGKKNLFHMANARCPYVQWEFRPEEMLGMGVKLGLFSASKDLVSLTRGGRKLLSMAKSELDLSHEQVAYIVEHCIFGNHNFSHLTEFLKMFAFDEAHDALVYDTTEYSTPDEDSEVLVQLCIVSAAGPVLKLNMDYVEFVSVSHVPVSQEQLDRILEEQRAIGRAGEELALEYERRRLSAAGHSEEAGAVDRVSLRDAGKGYDIASFEGASESLRHDLFIEVKARKRRVYSFIMSANEVRVARRLGGRYAVYFWNDLGRGGGPEPARVCRDPVRTLNIQECDNCLSYIVPIDPALPGAGAGGAA